MSRVVGLDLSLTKTGFVCDPAPHSPEEEEGLATLETVLRPKHGPADPVARLIEIRDLIHKAARTDYRDTLVVVEGYSMASAQKGHQLGELGGLIRVSLFEAKISYIIASPASVKQFATGKGNASKASVVSSVTHRSGRIFDSDDIVDALVCYSIGREWLQLTHPLGKLPQQNMKAMAKLSLVH